MGERTRRETSLSAQSVLDGPQGDHDRGGSRSGVPDRSHRQWHLGDDAWYPERQGFHENHGGCDYGQPPSYFDPYTNPRLPEGIPTLAPRLEGEYLTDREGDEAATFIAANRDRRFFLHLAPYAVHTPIQAPKELVDEWRAKEPTHQKNAAYAAMVERVDAAVGKVLDALDEHGLAESTLVIFTSDNGGLLGPTDNRPLRSGKGYPYEGGIRVPAIVRWPGVIPAGSVSNEPISSIDWYPTIVDATGVSPPKKEVDGRSLVEHLRRGGKTSLGRSALYWHFPHYRQGREVPPYSIIRHGDWKLIRWHEGPTFELYHLRDDPSERRDLAPSLPYLVAELDAQLLGHLVSVGAKIPRRNPEL
ncbi:MAG TPA: sulfatase-like hydrolase/transferase, partial [Planctomycetota bacterium]|nr:sulfatase-like hydrolase/transferase [Planctomycetota bacterium]